MKVRLNIDSDLKKASLVTDRLHGSRLDMTIAEAVFGLQDKEYTVTFGSKDIQEKIHNFEVAYYRGGKK